MSDNVVNFDGGTYADIPAEKVLEGAREWLQGDCLVVGYDEGGRVTFASSTGELAKIMFLLEVVKHQILDATIE